MTISVGVVKVILYCEKPPLLAVVVKTLDKKAATRDLKLLPHKRKIYAGGMLLSVRIAAANMHNSIVLSEIQAYH